MNKPNRKNDLRDDSAAKPSMGGTQKDIQDSTNSEDTLRKYNPVPKQGVQDAKVAPDSRVQKAKERALGKNYKHNTN